MGVLKLVLIRLRCSALTANGRSQANTNAQSTVLKRLSLNATFVVGLRCSSAEQACFAVSATSHLTRIHSHYMIQIVRSRAKWDKVRNVQAQTGARFEWRIQQMELAIVLSSLVVCMGAPSP